MSATASLLLLICTICLSRARVRCDPPIILFVPIIRRETESPPIFVTGNCLFIIMSHNLYMLLDVLRTIKSCIIVNNNYNNYNEMGQKMVKIGIPRAFLYYRFRHLWE